MPPPTPTPWCFLYLGETKSWWCGKGEEKEEEGEEVKKFSLKTHATTRGVGKNNCKETSFT